MTNRKPEPGDGPDYHADLQAWKERQTTYTPKVGDRVRVTRTLEGKVTDAERGHWMSPHFMLEVDGAGYHEIHDEDNWEIEKLRDPEPQWVNGDVVKVRPYIPAYRIGDKWLTCDGRAHRFSVDLSLSEHWQRGDVEILYKANAA